MKKEVAQGLFEALRALLPEDAAFVLVVIPRDSPGGDVVSNVVGGEAVSEVLSAVAGEYKNGRFFDEVRG
jgi:hypothetical protein